MSFLVCLSHREDVDGILSAALIKAAFKSKRTQTVLADYANILSKLQKIADNSTSAADHSLKSNSTKTNAPGLSPASHKNNEVSSISSTESGGYIKNESKGENTNEKNANGPENKLRKKDKLQRLFICDLGLSKKTQDKFVGVVKEIISKGVKVTYFDHHDISAEVKKELKQSGVTLIHSVEECTSVQIYNKFKNKLNSHAAFFAASAALTDYLETRPLASTIVSRYDRQFLMLEATALSYMISSNQHNEDFLLKAVDTMADMKYPHEIEGGFDIAERYAKKVAEGVRAVQGSIVTKKNVAYTQSVSDLSASVIVNFVLGISEKPVAMVYRLKEDIGSYIISIRASKACPVHLGRIVNEVASNMGGSGGGHEKACGAVVPKEKLEEFIDAIERSIVIT
jgi:oligoribonuclease NrnB/cAMP/cGMP phosphodiesterase (DHH superfamily)